MNNGKISAVGENLLVSIAYGDSVGLPVETKSRDYIYDKYGEIRSLEKIDNPYFGNDIAGVWSDDTQLSLAVAESLIEAGRFSMAEIVRQHILALEHTPQREFEGDKLPRGWGKSTWESVQRLQSGLKNYMASGNTRGEGNGVLMKLAPLALWQTAKESELNNRQVELLARMTHDNDLSVVTALVHRDILSGLFHEIVTPENILGTAKERASYYEDIFKNAGHKTSTLLGRLASLSKLSADSILDIAERGGFHSSETLVMAYGAFAEEPTFPESTLRVVNFGGDTDSTGSIVAAMSIMYSGEFNEPDDLEKIDELPRLISVGKDLARVSIGNN